MIWIANFKVLKEDGEIDTERRPEVIKNRELVVQRSDGRRNLRSPEC